MDSLIRNTEISFDAFQAQFAEGSMNVEFNPHLASIYMFFFLLKKYGIGDIEKQHRTMSYPAMYAEIACGKPLPDIKEWLHLHMYAREKLVLRYMRTWHDDYPYRDPSHTTYNELVTLESFFDDRMVHIKTGELSGRLPACDKIYLERTLFVIQEIMDEIERKMPPKN